MSCSVWQAAESVIWGRGSIRRRIHTQEQLSWTWTPSRLLDLKQSAHIKPGKKTRQLLLLLLLLLLPQSCSVFIFLVNGALPVSAHIQPEEWRGGGITWSFDDDHVDRNHGEERSISNGQHKLVQATVTIRVSSTWVPSICACQSKCRGTRVTIVPAKGREGRPGLRRKRG
jgi:hypothetical protein